MDSGFQSPGGIPDHTSKNFSDSEMCITFHGVTNLAKINVASTARGSKGKGKGGNGVCDYSKRARKGEH